MEFLGTIFNSVLNPIFGLFKLEMFAPALAMLISMLGASLVAIFAFDYFRKRIQVKSFSAAFEPFNSEADFAKNHYLVEQNLDSNKITLVWREYLETCIFPDLNDPRAIESNLKILNTYRPHEYFNLHSIFPPNAITNTLPNLFVGGGLVVTFMGLVAALATSADAITQITQNVEGSSQSDALMAPILELLRQASTKFYASFTALFFSLAISLELRLFQALLERPIEKVNEKLEGLVRYSPLEKIATDQLDQAQQQTIQLRAFNTNLATQIGERVQEALQQSMNGVLSQLGEISENLGRSNTDALQAASRELVEQTRGAAEESLRTLANRLNSISSGMQDLPSAISGGTEIFRQRMEETFDAANAKAIENIQTSGDASRQLIEELLAGLDSSIRDLTEASRESSMQLKNAAVGINDSVNLLANAMENGSQAAAARLTEGSAEAASRLTAGSSEAADRMTQASTEATDRMTQSSIETAAIMTAGAEQFGQSAARGAQLATDAFSDAADNFRNTVVESGRLAAENAGQQIEDGARDAVNNIADSLSTPISSLTTSASSFSNDISSLADRMQLLINTTSSLAGVTQDSSNSMSAAVAQLNDVVDQSAVIMQALQSATEPLPETINSLIQENGSRQQEYSLLLEEIRGFNETTSTQAVQLMQAWENHKTRFEQIDGGLSQAFSDLSGQIQQYVQLTQTITDQIDNSLNSAVGTLGGFLEDLNDTLENQRSDERTD